jgi:hypothetical protein
MDNPSEYLVVFNRGTERLAVLLDANLERIAEYNADSDEVEQLLEDAKELGPLNDDDWEKVFSSLDPNPRYVAAYRLNELG